MVRVVRTPAGSLAVGRTLPGRGAWLHRSEECIDEAVRRGAFSRALRASVGDVAAVCEDREFELQSKKGCR